MTNTIKVFLLIIGLAVCLLIAFITKTEAHQDTTHSSIKVERVVVTQSVVNTGTQWIIQTTYKLLKIN